MAVQNLEDVFGAIHTTELHLNPKKCMLFKREVKFLGHIVNGEGVATELAKVAAIRDWPTPRTTKEVRSFLWLASYYRHSIIIFVTVAAPLHQLNKTGGAFRCSAKCELKSLDKTWTKLDKTIYSGHRCHFITDHRSDGSVLQLHIESPGLKLLCHAPRAVYYSPESPPF